MYDSLSYDAVGFFSQKLVSTCWIREEVWKEERWKEKEWETDGNKRGGATRP